jgi:hypothetical protein
MYIYKSIRLFLHKSFDIGILLCFISFHRAYIVEKEKKDTLIIQSIYARLIKSVSLIQALLRSDNYKLANLMQDTTVSLNFAWLEIFG